MKLYEYDDDDLMDELESRGYNLDVSLKEETLDYVDSERIKTIVEIFESLNWENREKLFNFVQQWKNNSFTVLVRICFCCRFCDGNRSSCKAY